MNTLSVSHQLTVNLLAVATLAASAPVYAASQASLPHAPKADGPVSRLIAAPRTRGTSAVIIKLDGALSLSQSADLKRLGADTIQPLPLIQSVALHLPTRNLRHLAALPFVAHISSDGVVSKSDAFTVGSSGAGYVSQHYGLTGAGVGVAVIDSGIHFVNDFAQTPGGGASRIVGQNVFGDTNTDDFCGHGTHVAGIIAGNGGPSLGAQCFNHFYGIAPQANLINVKVLGTYGQSTVSAVINGLGWTVANAHKYNIRVINLSLGHPVGESYTTDPICQAVEAAYKAGIVVVCAAGNEGRLNGGTYTAGLDNEGWGTAYGSIQSPGNDPYVITVGATKNMDGVRADDRVATYSSRGPSRLDLVMKPDIIAPGNKVISANTNNSYLAQTYGATNEIPYSLYTTQNAGHLSNQYFQLSGTSMASPVVAGAAALMLQANPNLSPSTIKARLMLSADKWVAPDGTQDPLTYGAGYLNIPAALASTMVAAGPAASPALDVNSDGSVTVDLSRAMWGSSLWGTGVTDLRAMWGSRAMWGCSSVDMTRAMWGRNTTFSAGSTVASSAPSASRAMWGCSVWGDRAMWGCSGTAVDLTSTALSGE